MRFPNLALVPLSLLVFVGGTELAARAISHHAEGRL